MTLLRLKIYRYCERCGRKLDSDKAHSFRGIGYACGACLKKLLGEDKRSFPIPIEEVKP